MPKFARALMTIRHRAYETKYGDGIVPPGRVVTVDHLTPDELRMLSNEPGQMGVLEVLAPDYRPAADEVAAQDVDTIAALNKRPTKTE